MTGFVRASTGSRTRFHPLARGTNSGMRTTPRCRCSSAPIPVSAGNWDRDELRSARATAPTRSGTVVWDLLPDELGEALYDGVRAAETTGSAETLETALPPLEGDSPSPFTR